MGWLENMFARALGDPSTLLIGIMIGAVLGYLLGYSGGRYSR